MLRRQQFLEGKVLLRILRSLLVVVLLLLLTGAVKNYLYSDSLQHVRKDFSRSKPNTNHVVLLWNSFFKQKNWLPSPIDFNCSISNCIVTDDRKLLPVSSAIIFHWRNTDLKDLPKYRTPYQRWVLFNMEAPPYTPRSVLKGLESKINWTATYRNDSDLLTPYGWISRRRIPSVVEKPPPGRKLLCWLVSHCSASSNREGFVETLKRLIPVDIYGKCGRLRCPVEDRMECYRALSRRYKFYLSFENSICQDYVTEKVFTALSTDMVPVVMGGGNYREILPNLSYIDALSFDGPRQLADYLLELDKDEGKYLSYLAWKKDYEIIPDMHQWTCDLCSKLNTDRSTKVHTDLIKWWYDDANCSSVMRLKQKHH